MKSVFVTFADGSPEMISAAKRLGNQAAKTGIFSEILVLNDALLSDLHSIYRRDLPKIQRLDSFPLHYRASKAYAVQYTLGYAIGRFKTLCYMDAGNEIVVNRFSVRNLSSMIRLTEQEGGFAEQLPNPEFEYTKRELVEYLNPPQDDLNSGQVQATWFIMRVDAQNLELASRWVELSNPDLNLWQNPSNLEAQSVGFKDHRRDQSIFSLLWKHYQYPTRPAIRDFRGIKNASEPVQTRRNRTNDSEISYLTNTNVAGFLSSTFIRIRDFKNKLLKFPYRP